MDEKYQWLQVEKYNAILDFLCKAYDRHAGNQNGNVQCQAHSKSNNSEQMKESTKMLWKLVTQEIEVIWNNIWVPCGKQWCREEQSTSIKCFDVARIVQALSYVTLITI